MLLYIFRSIMTHKLQESNKILIFITFKLEKLQNNSDSSFDL